MSTLIKTFLNLLYPNRCIFCGGDGSASGDVRLCDACRKKLLSVGVSETKNGYLSVSAAVYTDTVRRAIINFKFNHRPQYAPVFAHLMEQALRYQADVDFITWVPTSTLRRMKRGYDQSELLARALGKRLDLPVVRCLRKIRHTKKQSLLNSEKRSENVRGKYRAYPERVEGKRMLVVDDVFTTGSTMNECIHVLYEAGASFCLGTSIARTETKRRK